MRHVPVLLTEILDALQLKPGSNVIDCTLGDAGHSEEILKLTAPDGKLLGIDADVEAILRAKQYLYEFEDRIVLVRNNFTDLKKIVEENKFVAVEGVLMDFGWSSPQFEERGRGFSFKNETEPLDMRYDNNQSNAITAEYLLNDYSVDELKRIFVKYGEERFAKDVAVGIVNFRKKRDIKIVGDLVNIILEVYRKKLKTEKEVPWVGGLHPATKVFQALRMVVNNELKVIENVLPQAVEVLSTGGRLLVITFHSLEDSIVKHYFKSQSGKTIKIINKKPIIATEEEVKNNPRARSAKLRIIEKI